jgi:hypothetical protein
VYSRPPLNQRLATGASGPALSQTLTVPRSSFTDPDIVTKPLHAVLR